MALEVVRDISLQEPAPPQSYFSLNTNKKTKLIYLGKKRQARAKKHSDNYRKLRAIVEEMTMINMTLLKENAWP